MADVSLWRNPDRFGGLYKIPIKMGLVLGSKISKNIFSMLLENLSRTLYEIYLLI